MVALLQVRELSKSFGGLMANWGINLEIEEGTLVGLIGPNGSGKTTFFNCISGYYSPDSGSVLFDERETTRMPPHRICKLGLARTFQRTRPFTDLTVLENVMVGAYSRSGRRSTAQREGEAVLALTGLTEKADVAGSSLTTADKKRVEIARALATQPRLLLLDEVASGLNPKETEEAVALIRTIRDSGVTIVLVEHVMEVVMPICKRVVVLESGRKIAEGIPEDICQDPAVIRAYLGEKRRA